MRSLVAAFAALVLCAGPSARAAEPDSRVSVLSLDAAFARALESHPDLRVFEPRIAALEAERERALLRPAWTASAELENVPGTGPSGGLQAAELTVSLATMLERGGKLAARRALADQRIDALGAEREARRLDLLAEAARRYLAIVGANAQRAIAVADIEQRERAVAAARRRLDAGASPESVVLTAEAALARAQLERDRALQRAEAARRHLVALWNATDTDFEIEAADPAALPPIGDMAALVALLQRTPELQQFASEQRVREARLQLARTESFADLQWSVGLRRSEGENDVGLVGGLSIPLGTRNRARAGVLAAQAELAALEVERESREAALRSTLAEAHGRYGVARLEAMRHAEDILPRLARAEAAAERAYRAGAISYLEWAMVQSEHITARRQQLDAALDAQRALIELQRLTAEPFVLDVATTRGIDP